MRPAARGVLFVAALMLCGCVHEARRGTLPKACSGVPGDFRTPDDGGRGAVAAHAPGAPGERYVAKYKPPTSHVVPLLLVFDERRDHVYMHTAPEGWLSHPAFEHAQQHAYWGEVSGDRYYHIPFLDKCSLQAMLEAPIDLRAPPGGLLFVQFTAPFCSECRQLTEAVRAEIARHPEVGFRWVQIEVPAEVGRLRPDKSDD